MPTVEDVNTQRVAKFADSITNALGGPGIELFRRLVEEYEREHDVPMADIAAALAVQCRGGEAFLMAPDRRFRGATATSVGTVRKGPSVDRT